MRSADECVAAPPLCAFLAAVKCAHHADTMTKLGFGCINTFAAFDDNKIEALVKALESAEVPPGHVIRIKRAVQQCRIAPTATAQRMGCTTLQFEHRNELPLRLLRMELEKVELGREEWRAGVHHINLVFEESRAEWAAELDRERTKLMEKETVLAAVKRQLGSIEKQRNAAEQAARRDIEAAQHAAAEEAWCAAEAECRARLHEMRDQLEALQVSVAAEAARADAAEERAAASEKRAEAAEMLVQELVNAPATVQKPRNRARSDCGAGSSSES